MHEASMIDAALAYAAQGRKVLALYNIEPDGRCACGKDCATPGKHPHAGAGFVHGAKDATLDPEILRAAYARFPNANIGIVPLDDEMVIDVDPRNGGRETWGDIKAKHGAIPDTAEQITGGDGVHILLRKPQHVTVSGKLGPGVDVKTSTGYIVAAPSNHKSGGRYVWEASSDLLAGHPVADAPKWLMDMSERPHAGTLTDGRALAFQYQVEPRTIADLRAAIAHINPDDRDEWVRMGQALKTIGDAGFLIWDEWSQRSPKYRADDMAYRWSGLQPHTLDYRTVFGKAGDCGWENKPAEPVLLAVLPELTAAEYFDEVGPGIENIKAPSWLIRNHIESDSAAMIYGAPAAGKSFFAIDWACCIATNKPWNGNKVKQGAVFYIVGEGHAGVWRRFRAWDRHNASHRLADAPLYKSKRAAQLLDPKSADAFCIAMREMLDTKSQQPALIIIDTLARNFGDGDENSTQDMTKFTAAVDKMREWFGCTVLLIHHTSKAGSARGSIVLPAAMDCVYQVEDEDGLRTLKTEKMKDGARPADMAFKLLDVDLGMVDDEQQQVTSAVLVPSAGSLSAQVTLNKNKQPVTAEQVLRKLDRGWLSSRALGDVLSCSHTAAQRATDLCVDAGWLIRGQGLSEEGRAALSMTSASIESFTVGGKPSSFTQERGQPAQTTPWSRAHSV